MGGTSGLANSGRLPSHWTCQSGTREASRQLPALAISFTTSKTISVPLLCNGRKRCQQKFAVPDSNGQARSHRSTHAISVASPPWLSSSCRGQTGHDITPSFKKAAPTVGANAGLFKRIEGSVWDKNNLSCFINEQTAGRQ